MLWLELRARRFAGAKFRRQVPLGRYVADFLSFERRLVVELDGGQHALALERDAERDRWFRSQGFRVLRFWNKDVLTNREGVLLLLEAELAKPSPLVGEGASDTRAGEGAGLKSRHIAPWPR